MSDTVQPNETTTARQEPSLFNRAVDVGILQRDRLVSAARRYFPRVQLDPEYLWEKLRSEEALAEREMRIFFHPRQIFPQGFDPVALAALNTQNYPLVEEPGYDYDPGFFSGDEWGLLPLRQKQVLAVQDIRFNYPSVDNQLFNVPLEWVRIDRKYGRLNIVPLQTPSSLPLTVFVLGALSGGRNIPLMLQVTYQAGILNAKADYPDLVDLIRKRTVINIIEDEFMPQSGSTSTDGISRSLSLDVDKYREATEKRARVINDVLNGPRIGFL
jgi:hypothetical protein